LGDHDAHRSTAGSRSRRPRTLDRIRSPLGQGWRPRAVLTIDHPGASIATSPSGAAIRSSRIQVIVASAVRSPRRFAAAANSAMFASAQRAIASSNPRNACSRSPRIADAHEVSPSLEYRRRATPSPCRRPTRSHTRRLARLCHEHVGFEIAMELARAVEHGDRQHELDERVSEHADVDLGREHAPCKQTGSLVLCAGTHLQLRTPLRTFWVNLRRRMRVASTPRPR